MGKIPAMKLGQWAKMLIIGLLTWPAPAWAVAESVTESFVATATTIQASGNSAPRVSYFALQMITPARYAGTVTAFAPGRMSDANAVWIQNQFNGSNGLFYVEFDSGAMADITSTDASTKTLSFAGNLPSPIAAGNAYRIRRHFTLADLFGANNDAGLLPGQNAAQADNVLLHMPQTQQTHTIFYSSVPGFTGWYFDNYVPAGATAIYPEQGVMVRRKGPQNLTLYLNGPTKEGTTMAPIFSGFNLVGTLKSKKALKLSELNLYTGNPSTGMAGASNPSSGDNLIMIRPDSTTTTFFYSNFPGFEGWYDSSFSASGNVVIQAGTSFFVHRKSPNGLFFWNILTE